MADTGKSVLRASYQRLRGRELPPDVPSDVLLATGLRSAVGLGRGALAGLRYGECGPYHLRSRRVEIRSAKRLRLGAGVILNEGAYIDAYSVNGVVLGDRVTVARNAAIMGSGVIREPGVGVVIGDDSAVGMFNIIWGQGGVSIGKNCLLAPHVVMVSENHGFGDSGTTIREQAPQRAPITIGDDCWLGSGVAVMAGVEIGSGCVIGAGAVVTRSIPESSIAVGVPARVVGSRS